MRVITFKIDEELLRELNRYVNLAGRSRSEVIRAALRKYLAEKRSVPKKRRVEVRSILVY